MLPLRNSFRPLYRQHRARAGERQIVDVASMGLFENWIDEAERPLWFLFECGRKE